MTVTFPPALDPAAHKGDAGRVLCVVGSPIYPGAAQLVAAAAVRGGAGLVTLALFHPELVGIVAAKVPEVVYLDLSRTKDLFVGRMPREISSHTHDVRVAGPGIGQGGHTRELVHRLVESEFEGPLLLDADALNLLAKAPEVLRQHPGPVVITPHPGEAARLLDQSIPADPDGRAEACRALAVSTGAVCVLKGRGTVVSDGTRHWVCDAGNPGMATAGAGDVLAGLMGAYLATGGGYSPFDAACAAVQVHARAGDLGAEKVGQRGLAASDLVAYLAAAQREAGVE